MLFSGVTLILIFNLKNYLKEPNRFIYIQNAGIMVKALPVFLALQALLPYVSLQSSSTCYSVDFFEALRLSNYSLLMLFGFAWGILVSSKRGQSLFLNMLFLYTLFSSFVSLSGFVHDFKWMSFFGPSGGLAGNENHAAYIALSGVVTGLVMFYSYVLKKEAGQYLKSIQGVILCISSLVNMLFFIYSGCRGALLGATILLLSIFVLTMVKRSPFSFNAKVAVALVIFLCSLAQFLPFIWGLVNNPVPLVDIETTKNISDINNISNINNIGDTKNIRSVKEIIDSSPSSFFHIRVSPFSSIGARLSWWQTSVAIAQKHALFGAGPNAFKRLVFPFSAIYSPNPRITEKSAPERPHNRALAIFSSLGYTGLFLELMIWCICFFMAYSIFIQGQNRSGIALFILFFTFSVYGLVSKFWIHAPAQIFGFICMFLLGFSNQKDSKTLPAQKLLLPNGPVLFIFFIFIIAFVSGAWLSSSKIVRGISFKNFLNRPGKNSSILGLENTEGYNLIRGIDYLKSSQFNKAFKSFEREIAVSGMIPSAYNNMALALKSMDNNVPEKLKKAVIYAEMAVFLSPFSNDLRLNCAELQIKSGLYDRARFNIDQVYETDLHDLRARSLNISIDKALNQIENLETSLADIKNTALIILKKRKLSIQEKSLLVNAMEELILLYIQTNRKNLARKTVSKGLEICGPDKKILGLITLLGGSVQKN